MTSTSQEFGGGLAAPDSTTLALRRQNHWLKALGLALTILCGVNFYLTLQARDGSVVEGSGFVVRDADGNHRAVLGLTSGNSPGLTLYDRQGDMRAWFHVLEDQAPRLHLLREGGRMFLSAGLDMHSNPFLALFDREQRSRFHVRLSDGDVPELRVTSADGKSRVTASFDESGLPALELRDSKGKTRAEIRLSEDGEPTLAMRDASGATTTEIPTRPSR